MIKISLPKIMSIEIGILQSGMRKKQKFQKQKKVFFDAKIMLLIEFD